MMDPSTNQSLIDGGRVLAIGVTAVVFWAFGCVCGALAVFHFEDYRDARAPRWTSPQSGATRKT